MWSNISSVQNNVEYIFIICKCNELFDKAFVNFWFDSENGSRIIISFRLSNNLSGIIKSSLSLLKYSIVFLIKFLGKPPDKNFFRYAFYFKIEIISYSFSFMWFTCYGITFITGKNFRRAMHWKLFWLIVNFCFYVTPTLNDFGMVGFFSMVDFMFVW